MEKNHKKISIKNRYNKNIVLIVDEVDNPKGLSFIMHGLGGFKEQNHIVGFAETFNKNNITTVRLDTTNTIGESDGKVENISVKGSIEDLEDVIDWAKSQDFYMEPFFLAGHSMGGLCTILYAEKHPEAVKGLAPIATNVSGELLFIYFPKEELAAWKKSGWQTRESKSKPRTTIRIPWSFMEEMLEYDVLDKLEKVNMPVVLIVGDKDDISLPVQQKLYEKLKGQKELHMIRGATHCFREDGALDEVKDYLDSWIKKHFND
ncbi:lysophospholipase [Patescibacteria group bacterium]|nr:lysophospholipase [Patescibacteria group bacterium]MBU1890385.1 lysophospholipase [Patescibacteria group bacterium]